VPVKLLKVAVDIDPVEQGAAGFQLLLGLLGLAQGVGQLL